MSVVGDHGPSEEGPGLSEEGLGLPEEDRDLQRNAGFFHVLLALLFLLLALQPYANIAGGLLVRLAFAGLLLAGLAAVSSRRRLFAIGIVLAVPAVALRFVPGDAPTVAGAVLTIATLVFICLVILHRMYKHPVVSSGMVSAALVVYLILGVMWAEAYWLVEYYYPDSFTGLSGLGDVDVQRDLFYYSYVTLSTLGYGDVSPVSPEARSLAITEAVVGQLYLVVMVAGLVGLRLAHSPRRPNG